MGSSVSRACCSRSVATAGGFASSTVNGRSILESEPPRGRNAKHHWSLGHLCLDLREFRTRIHESGQLAELDFRDVLAWVVLSPDGGRSALKRPPNFKHPLANGLDAENLGRFVRLSRLWDLASTQAGLFERHFRDKLRPMLEAHKVTKDVVDDILEPLAELVTSLVGIKQSKVSFLHLLEFDAESMRAELYNDAIVNIFTRLNTAGRALTRQEITFAWIKVGWDASKTENRTAGECFDGLSDRLAQEGVALSIDALVGAVSAMWSVLDRNGTLLTASDLLRGDKVRPMAENLVRRWAVVEANAVDGAALVRKRGLMFGDHYRSLNVLTLLLSWRLLGRQWLVDHPMGVTANDSFEKRLDAAFNEECDRWILLSQWSGRWGKSTEKVFADYVSDLGHDWTDIKDTADVETVFNALRERMQQWLGALRPEAAKVCG